MVPGAAERIIVMAEKEQANRHWMNRSFVFYRFAGLFIAFVLALAAIIGGIYLIASGHSAVGLALVLADLVALLAVFLVHQFRMNGD